MIDPIIASKPKVAAINVDIGKDATLLQSLPLVLTTAQIGQSRRLLFLRRAGAGDVVIRSPW
ncbi:hypothetical protein [Pseudorhizobium marinum]|uniref:hypothetical protein n=1 Tax=Pseudorhizobium marinum TaxID=1496690 RepID=UPI000496C175|nr:hypothetical protein [Pseudorhizobium marinum]